MSRYSDECHIKMDSNVNLGPLGIIIVKLRF